MAVRPWVSEKQRRRRVSHQPFKIYRRQRDLTIPVTVSVTILLYQPDSARHLITPDISGNFGEILLQSSKNRDGSRIKKRARVQHVRNVVILIEIRDWETAKNV